MQQTNHFNIGKVLVSKSVESVEEYNMLSH